MTDFGGNEIFSIAYKDGGPFFSVQIPFIYEHLFCKHFVRQSVGQATNGRYIIYSLYKVLMHLF